MNCDTNLSRFDILSCNVIYYNPPVVKPVCNPEQLVMDMRVEIIKRNNLIIELNNKQRKIKNIYNRILLEHTSHMYRVV